MMRAILLLTLAGGAALLTACGPNCQSTCEKLYLESECNTQRAGRTSDQLIGKCMENCQNAMKVPGEIGGFSPYEKVGSGQSIEIENEQQAAIWMDCISETACENIAGGMCAPVW